MIYLKTIIKRDNPVKPVHSPSQTCRGLCESSASRDESNSPEKITAEISCQSIGALILTESIMIRAINAPAPTEWIDIFHQKFIRVTATEINRRAKINDLKKKGRGKL
jgi:hypothetical protein